MISRKIILTERILWKGESYIGNREQNTITVDRPDKTTGEISHPGIAEATRYNLSGTRYLIFPVKKRLFSCIEAYESSYNAEEGRYDGYCGQVSPGYTAYVGNGDNESYIYDRYEYDIAESPTAHRQEQSICKRMQFFFSDMGRLIRSYI